MPIRKTTEKQGEKIGKLFVKPNVNQRNRMIDISRGDDVSVDRIS